MQPLDKPLRSKLETTVKEARTVAESAAKAVLEQLGVKEKTPFPHLTDSERDLRRKLRAHGRMLGDNLNGGKDQTMDRLVEEVAYEHWHRMLFARFLAENNLLMYPDPDDPVAVTLEECEDLAADEGAANGWELAARYAARMLPQIFHLDSPVFQLALPPEHQQKLERFVAQLPLEVFTASDSLGWVYQFWQAQKKNEINSSEVKIGARELSAVTQLFTEPYMVSFLLDNSLGAWLAARRLSEADIKNASSEEELRKKAAIPGVSLDYLRFVKKEDDTWVPAVGTYSAWPEQLSDLKTLDPCCGSGHFLVTAFLMLVPMRMELDGLSAKEAVDAVLMDNIHGLELDRRCVELAAFALALTAWKFPDAGGYRVLPELNVACSGLSVGTTRSQWEALADGDSKLRVALHGLYEDFKNAPIYGSLINPTRSKISQLIEWDGLQNAVEKALKEDRIDDEREAGVVAQGVAKAAALLAGQYQCVFTNVPYLARGKQNEQLRKFCERHYPIAKNDLATVFLDRCLEFCVEGGSSTIVLPQNWLFLTSYQKFREKLLKNDTWHLIARLGSGAFETISGEIVKAILVSLSRGNTSGQHKELLGETNNKNLLRGLDVSTSRSAAEKATALLTAEIKSIEQVKQIDNPDMRVGFYEQDKRTHISSVADCYQGLVSGDIERFTKKMWEVIVEKNVWVPFRRSNNFHSHYGNVSEVLLWENGNGQLHSYAKEARNQLHDMHESGNRAWGCYGVAINRMGDLRAVPYYGEHFDNNVAVVFPLKNRDLNLTLYSFFASDEFPVAIRELDQAIKVTNRTLLKVPFDIHHWEQVATEKYPNGLPNPYSDDPTQLVFHGHPFGSVVWDEKGKWTSHGPLRSNETILQITVARLLGYRWPAELDDRMELADEQREWVNRCENLISYGDDDGIVCIPSLRGEASAADRLLNLLAAAYGNAWSTDTLAQLLKNADHAGKTLESWLREKFFAQHCKLFQHRPFIWHIWDGLRDGFAALINYHKLDAKLLEALIYTYLGDWISRQKQDIAKGVDGSQEKLAAAENLKKKLELILEGEAPYDIFVRWKPTEKQPIGWNPDLNDGVRLNIRPFMTVPDVGKKGAGILRDKPNIKWNKDRGKDVESAPWYHIFKGDRINDHHLSLDEKRTARKRAQ